MTIRVREGRGKTPETPSAEDADQAVSTGVEQEEAVSAWERIRRSKVMESCFAYGAGGFVLLEAMDVFSGVWGWPLLVQKLFTLVLALGLLMAAAVAWFQSEGRGERRWCVDCGIDMLIVATMLAGLVFAVQLTVAFTG